MRSLDQYVGTLLKLQRYVEAQRFCGLDVEDQLVLGRWPFKLPVYLTDIAGLYFAQFTNDFRLWDVAAC